VKAYIATVCANCRLALLTAVPPPLWAVGWEGYVSTAKSLQEVETDICQIWVKWWSCRRKPHIIVILMQSDPVSFPTVQWCTAIHLCFVLADCSSIQNSYLGYFLSFWCLNKVKVGQLFYSVLHDVLRNIPFEPNINNNNQNKFVAQFIRSRSSYHCDNSHHYHDFYPNAFHPTNSFEQNSNPIAAVRAIILFIALYYFLWICFSTFAIAASDRRPWVWLSDWVSHTGCHGYWFPWLWYSLVVAMETELKSQLIDTRWQQSMVVV